MTNIMARIGRKTALVAAVTLGLALVACGDDDGGASTESGSGSNDSNSGSGTAVQIVSPTDGGTIEPNFDIELESDEEIGETDTGNFHFHVFVDGDEEDYEIVYSTSQSIERNLSPGEHTIEAALANPDHSLVGDDARDQITVTVGEGAAGGGGAGGGGAGDSTTSTTAADEGGGGGYGY
jgi:hypothetical protein